VSVSDTDRGYDALRRALGAPDVEVLVGVREEAGAEVVDGSDLTIAGLATIHEFGAETPFASIPERSFLRSTLDENRDRYLDEVARGVGDTIDGKTTGARVLERVGARAAGDVKRKIIDLSDPENAPSTIEQKGSSNPLVDTGRLAQSIDHEVRTSRGRS
jgi:hypothetical protein